MLPSQVAVWLSGGAGQDVLAGEAGSGGMPRMRAGAQGQNAYLSRASRLRSAPNQQLFWS